MPVGAGTVGPGIQKPGKTSGGTISDITSPGNSIAITNAAGPTTNLDVNITSVADHRISDYDVTNALTTFMTTQALSVGRWLVTLSALVYAGSTNQNVEITTKQGTATATFEGCYSGELNEVAAAASPAVPVTLSFIADVTVAGTLVFQAIASGTTGTPAIVANTSSNGYSNATGYTAIRIGVTP